MRFGCYVILNLLFRQRFHGSITFARPIARPNEGLPRKASACKLERIDSLPCYATQNGFVLTAIQVAGPRDQHLTMNDEQGSCAHTSINAGTLIATYRITIIRNSTVRQCFVLPRHDFQIASHIRGSCGKRWLQILLEELATPALQYWKCMNAR